MSEGCYRNHWSIAQGDVKAKFCPYCGEDISRFQRVEWISPEYDAEEKRALDAFHATFPNNVVKVKA